MNSTHTNYNEKNNYSDNSDEITVDNNYSMGNNSISDLFDVSFDEAVNKNNKSLNHDNILVSKKIKDLFDLNLDKNKVDINFKSAIDLPCFYEIKSMNEHEDTVSSYDKPIKDNLEILNQDKNNFLQENVHEYKYTPFLDSFLFNVNKRDIFLPESTLSLETDKFDNQTSFVLPSKLDVYEVGDNKKDFIEEIFAGLDYKKNLFDSQISDQNDILEYDSFLNMSEDKNSDLSSSIMKQINYKNFKICSNMAKMNKKFTTLLKKQHEHNKYIRKNIKNKINIIENDMTKLYKNQDRLENQIQAFYYGIISLNIKCSNLEEKINMEAFNTIFENKEKINLLLEKEQNKEQNSIKTEKKLFKAYLLFCLNMFFIGGLCVFAFNSIDIFFKYNYIFIFLFFTGFICCLTIIYKLFVPSKPLVSEKNNEFDEIKNNQIFSIYSKIFIIALINIVPCVYFLLNADFTSFTNKIECLEIEDLDNSGVFDILYDYLIDIKSYFVETYLNNEKNIDMRLIYDNYIIYYIKEALCSFYVIYSLIIIGLLLLARLLYFFIKKCIYYYYNPSIFKHKYGLSHIDIKNFKYSINK